MAILALPRQWQSYVDKLRVRLASDGLLDVLESFPLPSSFEFQDTTIREQKAVRLHLGEREQDDATRANSWAYIVHDNSLQRRKGEPEPSVFIRDELRGSDNTPRLSKRAATSLLRKAVELLPPFCFLQFDSQDKATHVRDMLCALVLYYSLVNGLTETAIKWSKFESSLMLALEYIDDSTSYQRWQNAQNTDTEAASIRRRRRRVRPQKVSHDAEDEGNTEDEIDTATSDSSCKDGVVYSLGSAISVEPDSHLAKLITALGDRASLLDAIPSTAITFNRQNLVPEYCPIMLKLGTYGECIVHVCLTQGVKGDTRILAQDPDGHLLRWKFQDLTGIDLVEPFDSIMRLNQELKSRGSKIRYLVFYYFMLAEHAGLIGKISAPWKHDSMVPGLSAACNRLRNTSTGDTTDEDILSNDNRTANKLQKGVQQSLIVKLRVNPDIVIAHTKTAPITEREEAESGAVEPNLERRFVLGRAVSVLSISSDEEKAGRPEEKLEEETFAPQKQDPGSLGRSEIIYLSSDEEIVLPEHIKQAVERTPEIGAIPGPPRPTVVDYDSDELRWPSDAKRKRKRSSTALSISNDDDDLMEADGNAWKTASLGRSGDKGTPTE